MSYIRKAHYSVRTREWVLTVIMRVDEALDRYVYK